jgi:protocatechuate 3,4-dioxygenase beta subunit
MAHWSRRLFVTSCLAVPVALVVDRSASAESSQGLGQFASEGPPPCKADDQATPAAPQGPEFKPGAPERSSLIEPGVTGTRLALTGSVRGLTCGPIARARLDFWQADAGGVYDASGYRLRGHEVTDGNGRYRLETIVPGPHDRQAPQLHVKVQPPGKPAFATRLFFPDQPQNKMDPQFRQELVMKVSGGPAGKTATFDIVLNL